MNVKIDIDDALSARIENLAERLRTSPSHIIREALENGRSVSWQEEWTRRVEAGISASYSGDFVSDSDIEALLAGHRENE